MARKERRLSTTSTPDTAFQSAPRGIAYLVGRLDRLLRRHLGEVLSPQGLSVQQYTALAMLGARGPLSNAQLADRSFVTPQTANEMVKGMEMRGWVDRASDPEHGRVIFLRLTTRGREVLDRAHAAAAALETRMLADLSEPERARIHRALSLCVQSLGAMLAEDRA